MSDRELDALIATRVMGMVECSAWRESNLGSAGGPCMMLSLGLPPNEKCPNGHGRGECFSIGTGYPGSGPAKYSTDRNAAALVLERIGELGLVLEFEREFTVISGFPAGDILWFALTAMPRHLMEAALKCVDPGTGEGTSP